ncbi:hypothetical protein CIPAW_09G047300 [Carya illinoinensis]|uniref:Uncharacterized protein n=1 Tax=Carya illinoinensis TaxID=32201 RepID=A0A8T1PH66_CARIL|nr:hypothetical protein CIPAW_09G047300 [Carya illinoinensis]
MEVHFPDVTQRQLPRVCSDHFPILLDCGGIQGGKRYFKFKNMWFNSDGFVNRVKQWWSSYDFQGSPSFILARKLKALKHNLKQWNEQLLSNVLLQQRSLLEELQGLEGEEEARTLSESENTCKSQVVTELKRVLLIEEISWRQKLRALWLKEGDKSTKFFHRVANSHRRNNAIDTLMVD